MWILSRVGGTASRRQFIELIGPPSTTFDGVTTVTTSPVASGPRFSWAPVLVGGAMLLVAPLVAPAIASEEFSPPSRQALIEFPLQLGTWRGVSVPLEQHYLDVLQLDDYAMADYAAERQGPINVYVAYYSNHKKGNSAHSPKTCIPGDGWEITSFEPISLDRVSAADGAFDVNRVVIQKDGRKQIVYYWFKHRDRWITSEYAVKYFLFWDSLTRQRADGALVRLVSGVSAGETETMVDERLHAMARLVSPLLSRFVPD
jgi:EpsI family protein